MKAPWYNQGLSFECQRCRGCCGGAPGFVWVSSKEIERISAALGYDVEDFRARYCRHVAGRISLCERPNGDCVLLGPEGCLVYESRPLQCRTFPFWPEHLATPDDWRQLSRECPGVDCGRKHSLQEIRRELNREE